MTNGQGNKPVERRRTAARLAAVQALYQIDMTDAPVLQVTGEFLDQRLREIGEADGFGRPDRGFFETVLAGAASDMETEDRMIASVLADGWSLDRLETIMRAILRAGAWELLNHEEVPPAVIITEYVDIAHCYFNEKEPGFVNGVLDRLARICRDGDGG